MQTFDSGATRNADTHKFDYEGFINPEVLHAFGEYMHEHRLQKDGTLRDSDNWQKGIPLSVYVKSLVRHTFDLWRMHRGFSVTNPDTGQPHTKQELCCAIMFNVMGYLKETLAPAGPNASKSLEAKAPSQNLLNKMNVSVERAEKSHEEKVALVRGLMERAAVAMGDEHDRAMEKAEAAFLKEREIGEDRAYVEGIRKSQAIRASIEGSTNQTDKPLSVNSAFNSARTGMKL